MSENREEIPRGLDWPIKVIAYALMGGALFAMHYFNDKLEQRKERNVQESALVSEVETPKIVPKVKEPVQKERKPEPIVPEPVYESKTKSISYKTEDFSEDTDEVLLARMLFGEARGCSDMEKIAVAYTAINRTRDGKAWNGETLREVILKPWQYSCFNKNDPNVRKLMNPEKHDANSWRECLEIAEEVLSDKYGDPTKGATHYFNPDVVKPSWSEKMTRIGRINGSRHEFYRED